MAFSEKHYRTNEPSEWTCLSTDTKDTPSTNGKIKVTDIAYETDTGDKYEYRGSTAGWVQTDSGGGTNLSQLANERNPGTANQYGVGVDECEYASVTSDTDISSSTAGLLFGVLVTATTATDIIEIRDATSAGTGTVVLSIPAATAAGTFYDLKGAKLDTGIYADFTGTGTIVVLWRAQ